MVQKNYSPFANDSSLHILGGGKAWFSSDLQYVVDSASTKLCSRVRRRKFGEPPRNPQSEDVEEGDFREDPWREAGVVEEQ